MANYAPNYTSRLRVSYTVLGTSHSTIFRCPVSTTDPAPWADKVEAFLTAIKGIRFQNWYVTGASFCTANSDIFLPCVAPAPEAGTAVAPSTTGMTKTVSTSFVGRSVGGHKARFYLYGLYTMQSMIEGACQDFRVLATENAGVLLGIGVLNGEPQLMANDGQAVSWYPYVNTKQNDYQVRKARRG